MTLEKVHCVKDHFTESFATGFIFFTYNVGLAKFLMIGLGLLTDFIFLYFIYHWVVNMNPKTWRFPVALIAAHVLRILFVTVFKI